MPTFVAQELVRLSEDKMRLQDERDALVEAVRGVYTGNRIMSRRVGDIYECDCDWHGEHNKEWCLWPKLEKLDALLAQYKDGGDDAE